MWPYFVSFLCPETSREALIQALGKADPNAVFSLKDSLFAELIRDLARGHVELDDWSI
jgi:hypothetical protein